MILLMRKKATVPVLTDPYYLKVIDLAKKYKFCYAVMLLCLFLRFI